MKEIYIGKTKDVFQREDGNYILRFKDDVTGVDGVFDPGANEVGLSIDGIGNKGLQLTTFFYNYLNEQGIKTHFVSSDLNANEMCVIPAQVFGQGLEVICRLKATGSFMRRYGAYAKEGMDLDYFCEITLKDDERLDPPISKDALINLNILSADEYDILIKETKEITKLVSQILKRNNIKLYDIKLEFGRSAKDNSIILIDEISGGNMRAYLNNEILDPIELSDIILSNK